MSPEIDSSYLEEREKPHDIPQPQILTITDEAIHTQRQSVAAITLGEELPFSIRLVRTEEHLLKAVRVRAQAFLRHAPQFGRKLLDPEPADRAKGNIVLLAESKATGAPEGSIRIETNFDFRTEFESVIELPPFLRGKTLAQVGRLGVKPGSGGTLVKQTLFKALYRYCLATQVDYMLVAARTPVDRDFQKLGFREVFDEPTLLSYPSQGKKYLRLFVFDVAAGERMWRQSKHPLYQFMIQDYHPDIEIFSSIRGMWAKPRSRSAHGAIVPDYANAFDFPVV